MRVATRSKAVALVAAPLLLVLSPTLLHADRTATYVAGTAQFSQNVTLKAPVSPSCGEPSIRVDVRGNCYVGGIRGVPAGVDLWRFDLNPASPGFDPGLQYPTYLGQPDAFFPQDPSDTTAGGADGGGDIDIAVGFPTSPDSVPVVTIVSLAAANVSSARSYDRGEHFYLSPLGSVVPVDDRQWCEATGPNTVFLMYRAPLPSTTLHVQRSDDHGGTYGPPAVASPVGGRPGYIAVDHTTGPFAGRVYMAYGATLDGALHVARSSDNGLTWTDAIANADGTHSRFFDVVKVGRDGTVYVCWADDVDIWMSHSTDGGVTWAPRVRVNDHAVYKSNLFSWMDVGDNGRVDIVWYGTPTTTNNDNSDWDVLFAQSTNATSGTPTFYQQVVSDHRIHGSNVSEGGTTGSANRNLLDYFQVAVDPQGAAVIAFTDDHNDFNGHTYVTRQLTGTSVYANANGNGTVSPIIPPPLPAPSPSEPQVTDFLHDATLGLLEPIFTDSPFDILWANYGCEAGASSQMLVATLKLSSLSTIPAGTSWRVCFTANAPGGLSDRGDQFFVRAFSGNPASPTYAWGTAVRNNDGSLTYTDRGALDFGVFDQAAATITMKVSLAKLDSLLAAKGRPTIGIGSVLYGLRAMVNAGSGSRDPLRDFTRGGTSYTVPNCSATPTVLDRFTAEDVAAGIRLAWRFTVATSFTQVSIERATSAEGAWSAIEAERSSEGALSTALDRAVESGRTYYYRLVATASDGSHMTFGPLAALHGVDASARLATFLAPPSPNPASANSAIAFTVARPGFVELAVLDAHGRRVRTLQAAVMAPGQYTRTWNGQTDGFAAAPPGIYFVALHTSEGVQSRRIALVR